MAKVLSHIGRDLYRIEIKTPTGNVIVADEPLDNGGQDKGFSPKELLAASLAACTSATIRMYADRKGWDVAEINTETELERDGETNKTLISRKIQLVGNLDEAQKARLLIVANSCPVHKILSSQIVIETQLK